MTHTHAHVCARAHTLIVWYVTCHMIGYNQNDCDNHQGQTHLFLPFLSDPIIDADRYSSIYSLPHKFDTGIL